MQHVPNGRYLHNAVRPALANPVSCPHVVSIFCQSLHKSVLIGSQLDMVEIQRGRLVAATLHVSKKQRYVSERVLKSLYRNNHIIIIKEKQSRSK